ncbi:MAG: peptide deformylase [Bacteroidales bacterium]|jgi:peptide deformylase|nr:peptide deformylase [Bacteroidales bacterium]
MILPIVVYGHPALKAKNKEVESNYPELQKLIDDMFDTMRNADGVGLAAPQINKNIRLFVVDLSSYELPEDKGGQFKQVFINPVIVEREGEPEYFNEGCLSVPDIHEDVLRPPRIRIKYFDRDWNLHDEWFDGIPARVCQHEYDHVEGIVFVEYLSNLKKMVLHRKLTDMTKGVVNAHYKTISTKR